MSILRTTRRPWGFPIPAFATVFLLVVLSGCRLEDQSPDADAGVIDTVQAEAPGPEGPGGEARERGEDHAPLPVLLLDDDFWDSDGELRAVELNVRFVSAESRRLLLDADAPVGRHDGREWTLVDILVAVDFRGGPLRARWQVAGPSELIAGYLDGLRDHPADRTPIVELGVLEMEPRYCCPDDEGWNDGGRGEDGGIIPGSPPTR